MGGLISGLLGGGESSGQQQQMGALRAARGDIQAYRPEAMQARLNALNNMTSAYQGANNALETLWGDPNAKPKIGGPRGPQPAPPQRMMGHDLPQRPGPPQQQQGGGFNPLDPLGIFGGK